MTKEQEKPYQYWLMNVKGVGRKRKLKLLQKLGSAEEIYRALPGTLQALLGEKPAEKIVQAKENWNILTEYEKLCRQKIKFTCYGDDDYPERLSEIPDAPFGLYYQGCLPSDHKPSAALIGARACSGYGMYAAREFGSKLAAAGIQIISGLAMGIDGISQEAALEAGGESFGVLGCGVDICYPKSNRSLYEKCKQKGGILSEYPPGVAPAAYLFPPRNRIISGLSDIIVVVEAREKSGTLITVDMALEQGREVFAIPGRITDPLSRGCNALFKQGAGVAVCPADILEALHGFRFPINIEETEKNIVTAGLSEQEKYVYECLDILPETAEEIYRKTGKTLTIQEVMGLLVELCLKGFAKKEPEGYSKKILAT
ncbi:MAG: DNA-protecting protein DprA [Lachnospiraceae bacterium]|nr:DNA-protecting protein DprA [Lachnospiraceae bacterium]